MSHSSQLWPGRTSDLAALGSGALLRWALDAGLVLDARGEQPLVAGPSYQPVGSPPPEITATLQRRHRVISDKELGWVPIEGSRTVLTSIDAEFSRTPFYTGQVPVPPQGRHEPLRLLVVETEAVQADGGAPGTTQGHVVYCDAVELPSDDGPRDGRDGDGPRDGRFDGRGGGHHGRHG